MAMASVLFLSDRARLATVASRFAKALALIPAAGALKSNVRALVGSDARGKRAARWAPSHCRHSGSAGHSKNDTDPWEPSD